MGGTATNGACPTNRQLRTGTTDPTARRSSKRYRFARGLPGRFRPLSCHDRPTGLIDTLSAVERHMSRIFAFIPILLSSAIPLAAQQYRPNPSPGEERSANVRLIGHLAPVNASGPYNVSDIEME